MLQLPESGEAFRELLDNTFGNLQNYNLRQRLVVIWKTVLVMHADDERDFDFQRDLATDWLPSIRELCNSCGEYKLVSELLCQPLVDCVEYGGIGTKAHWFAALIAIATIDTIYINKDAYNEHC